MWALFGNGWGSYNVNGWILKKILSKKQIRLCSLDCQKFPLFLSSGISFLFMLKVFSFLISSFYSERPFQETVWIFGTVQHRHTHTHPSLCMPALNIEHDSVYEIFSFSVLIEYLFAHPSTHHQHTRPAAFHHILASWLASGIHPSYIR